MDHELIAYLDAQFREFGARFGEMDARFGEMDARFGEMDARFGEMAARFGEIDARFRESAQQIEGLREEMSQQFAREREETDRQFTDLRGELDVRFTRVEETARHAHVLIEGLRRGEVRIIAEAVSGFDGKLEAVRSELKEEIGEVRVLLQQSYRHLDRRVG